MSYVEPRQARRRLPRVFRWSLWDFATSETSVLLMGSLLALAVIVGFLLLAASIGPDVWVPMLVLLVISAISIPFCKLASGRPIDRRLQKLLIIGFALKMLCVFPRYAMNEYAYGRQADARNYHDGGAVLRQNVHNGIWSVGPSYIAHFPSETRFVAYVVGTIYLVTGASQMASYFLFTWFGWIGLMCCFRAFQVAYPNAPPYLAAKLIFFLPSLLYWPSSLGKDALMLFGIGLLTLGLTRLMMANKPWLGLLFVVLGAAPMVEIRPHILLIALAGAGASVIARNAEGAPASAAIGRFLVLIAMFPALLFGLSRMNQIFGASGDNGFDVATTLNHTSTATAIGGSAFQTQPVHSPIDMPVAIVNVLYRPFIFEAHNIPSIVSAIEGTVLIAMTIVGARWLWRMGPEIRRNPVAAFCAGYVIAFVFAFSNIGNAGILSRQRIQVFPVLMILVAAAAEAHRLNNVAVEADLNPAPAHLSLVPNDPRLVTTP